MQQFELVLKNERLSTSRRVATLIYFLHLFVFSYLLLRITAFPPPVGLPAGLAITLFALILQFIASRKNKFSPLAASWVFILLAFCWAAMGNNLIGLVLLLLGLLDYLSVKKQVVLVTEDNISISSLPKKTVTWDQLSNVILKDKILTLDFKNDRLLQAEVSKESYSVDEDGFNQFCAVRLKG